MKKYLSVSCVALLALAACDDNGSNTQQSQTGAAPAPVTAQEQSPTDMIGSMPVETRKPGERPAAPTLPPTEPTLSDDHGNETYGDEPPGVIAQATQPAPAAESDDRDGVERIPDRSKSCGDYSDWVGKPVDEEAVKSTNDFARIIKPGDAVTKDYNADRVNVDIDNNNMVTRVWCG
jgi:hypothetical protein